MHYLGYTYAGAEVVALADISEEALKVRQADWNVIKGYTDYKELLKDDEIDVVSICTPNAFHHPATVAAAEAGKHVLCEKPISLSLDKAQDMIDSCEANNVLLQIGHHMRSNLAAVKAKTMIDRGDLGRITFARFRQAHDWGGAETVKDSFGKKALAGGGTLLDNGCHMFDLARYFCGEVKSVYCEMDALKFDVEVEDTSLVSLRFKSGTIGSVENAWTATGWEEGFWLYGTKGSLEYTNRWEKPVLKHKHRSSPSVSWDGTDLSTHSFFHKDERQSNHSLHVANFLAAIRGEREVICTGKDGLEAVRLVLASYESSQTGQAHTLA